jgi:putative acetyltransferase
MVGGDVAIALESPRRTDVMRLIEELDAYQTSLYPAESNHLLDVDALASPSVRFFVARRDGEALACGALRIDGAGYGEIKRMYVSPSARGAQIGRRILRVLEEEARREGLGCLRLETGIHQAAAIALYRAEGYAERGPFGEYTPDPLSLFLEKKLGEDAR